MKEAHAPVVQDVIEKSRIKISTQATAIETRLANMQGSSRKIATRQSIKKPSEGTDSFGSSLKKQS